MQIFETLKCYVIHIFFCFIKKKRLPCHQRSKACPFLLWQATCPATVVPHPTAQCAYSLQQTLLQLNVEGFVQEHQAGSFNTLILKKKQFKDVCDIKTGFLPYQNCPL